MAVRDKHILVDGYNLELRQGTGIKTYGLSLIQALGQLGARVSVLWSCRKARNPLVQDVLLHDDRRSWPGARAYVAQAARSLLGLSSKASAHVSTGHVIPHRTNVGLPGLLHKSYVLPNCYKVANHLARAFGTTVRARLPDRVDAWHATYPLPISIQGAPKITTVHDLVPLKMPWATRDDKHYYHRTVKDALQRSELVVTVSEHVKRDILELFEVPEERVQVTYQALPHGEVHVAPDELTRQLRIYGLQPQSYLLFVSSIHPRKNLGRLCQALAYMDCDLPLVVVGGKGWSWEEELRYAEPLAAKGRALFLDHVPGGHLHALYAGALFFAFPSLYEGFGLPPLEAMAHGCPVLTSNASCLPEVCGDAAVYVDPYDVSDLADKIQALIEDEGLRDRLRENGRRRLEHFSPENYCNRLLAAYGKVLS